MGYYQIVGYAEAKEKRLIRKYHGIAKDKDDWSSRKETETILDKRPTVDELINDAFGNNDKSYFICDSTGGVYDDGDLNFNHNHGTTEKVVKRFGAFNTAANAEFERTFMKFSCKQSHNWNNEMSDKLVKEYNFFELRVDMNEENPPSYDISVRNSGIPNLLQSSFLEQTDSRILIPLKMIDDKNTRILVYRSFTRKGEHGLAESRSIYEIVIEMLIENLRYAKIDISEISPKEMILLYNQLGKYKSKMVLEGITEDDILIDNLI